MRIAVIGSAVNGSLVAREIGRYLAEAGHIVLTGACGGSPGDAETAAVVAGGTVLGYSPAANEEDHVKLGLPARNGRATIFTGEGFKRRNLAMIEAAQAVIMINGGFGTLDEALNTLEAGLLLLVIEGTGGATRWILPITEDLRPDHLENLILCPTALDAVDRLAKVQ